MRLHQHIRREQARHTDDWLITYADTITLLLCLFVIMLSIKTGAKAISHDDPEPVARTAMADGIFWGQPIIRSLTPITEPATEATTPEPITDVPQAEPQPETPRRISTSTSRAAPVPMPATEEHAVQPEPVAADTAAASVVNRLQSRGTVVVASQGDRITTLQIGSTAFFDSGSAGLSPAGKSILGEVAVTLNSAAFAAYRVTIEGHTDDTPISTPRFQSNWELSTARAAAVVRCLLDLGVPASKLTAAGYADTFPIAPNRNVDGTANPDNQARNRRVVIKLEKIDRAERKSGGGGTLAAG